MIVILGYWIPYIERDRELTESHDALMMLIGHQPGDDVVMCKILYILIVSHIFQLITHTKYYDSPVKPTNEFIGLCMSRKVVNSNTTLSILLSRKDTLSLSREVL